MKYPVNTTFFLKEEGLQVDKDQLLKTNISGPAL